jgi:phosphoesterase RecJ-like protein
MIRLNTHDKLRLAIESTLKPGIKAALVTHRNPDGDGFCACIAMQEIFRLRGIVIDIVLEKPIPPTYEFLEGSKRSIVFTPDMAYETVIMLDCHETQRIGVCSALLDKAQHIIIADHHEEVKPVENSSVFIDPKRVSIGAVVFDMWEHEIAGMQFTSRTLILNALYTTILNDTDNFANLNTDAATFDSATRMCVAGLIPTIPVREFIFRKTVPEMFFLSEVLSTGDFREGALFVISTRAMLERQNLSSDATSIITRWLKGTRGMQLLGYFREEEPNQWRASLRADEIDVQRIAIKFGGGGHPRASGFDFTGPVEELKALVIAEIHEQ